MKHFSLKSTLMAVLAVAAVNIASADQPHVYINPGHGGYDSDDRNMVIYPFSQGDSAGSWESKSNLRKGLALQDILQRKGYKTSISRVTNTTADDLNLSTIVALCNQSGADVFYSIHSNATGTSDAANFPMVFYRGYTGSPQIANADVLAADLEPYLYASTTTVWTNNYQIWGDWSFRPEWGTQGYGVLRGNHAVANLSEGSFHDYIPEAYRLLSPYYCWMEAWNISLGADKYFDRLGDYGLGAVTGNVRDDRIERLQECAQPFIIYGDDGLMPIHGATVRLLDQAGNEVQRCITDTLRNGIYVFKFVAPGNYTVEVSEPHHFTQTAPITVQANAPTYQNFYIKRVRETPPVVVQYNPVWNEGDAPIKCSEQIILDFNWDMDTASVIAAFDLQPAITGKFTWEDSYYRMIFTPDDAFDVNTLYTLTLHKSAKHAGDTPMDEDFVMQFYTQGRNHLTELAVFPYEGAPVHLKTPTVELRVDSMLETYNLFTRLRVLDSEGTEMAWNKRSIKYNKTGDPYGYIRIPLTKSLDEGANYSLILDRDIADTAGIHLAQARIINFKAVNAGADKPGMSIVEGFESTDGFSSADESAQLSLTAASEKLFGNKSLQMAYEFDDEHNAIVMNDANAAETTTFTRGDSLGIHLWGDMSYNQPYALLTSGASTIEVPLGQITYHGWRYIAVPLDELNQGEHYVFTGIKLSRGHEVMGQSGAIKFDNLLKAATSGIKELPLAGLKVNCNGDYIVASADTWIQGIDLLNTAGQMVKTVGGNCMNVSGMAPGVYIVRVYINGRTSTQKVVIN